jgi:preprotein translocase subunit SecE
MVNRKVSQASSRSAPASPRNADQEPTKRPSQSSVPAKSAAQRTAPAATPAKAVTAQRPATETPSRLAAIQRTFRETVAELRKVQWPDRVTTRNLTLVVIGMSAVLAAILGLLDAGLTRLIEWLVQL